MLMKESTNLQRVLSFSYEASLSNTALGEACTSVRPHCQTQHSGRLVRALGDVHTRLVSKITRQFMGPRLVLRHTLNLRPCNPATLLSTDLMMSHFIRLKRSTHCPSKSSYTCASSNTLKSLMLKGAPCTAHISRSGEVIAIMLLQHVHMLWLQTFSVYMTWVSITAAQLEFLIFF